MGKIRVKTFGDEAQENEEKKKKEQKRAERKAREDAEQKDTDAEEKPETSVESPEASHDQTPNEAAQDTSKAKPITSGKTKKKNFIKKKAFHSQKYEQFISQVDRSKSYTLNEALELLKKVQRGKFDETVELHINTATPSVSGNVTLPHGTGKKTRVAVADDNLIAEIEKGVINFDILVATPAQMPKLAKVAKILGPRGLMPNPKNGTITDNPQDLVKKYEGGQINFKTEGKNPLLHLTVGKISFGNEKLSENIEEMLKAVKKSNIVNATLKSTMSPGIKIKV